MFGCAVERKSPVSGGDGDCGSRRPVVEPRGRFGLRRAAISFIVLLVLIAIWQALSLTLGTYWVGSPWGVLTRFVAASSAANC